MKIDSKVGHSVSKWRIQTTPFKEQSYRRRAVLSRNSQLRKTALPARGFSSTKQILEGFGNGFRCEGVGGDGPAPRAEAVGGLDGFGEVQVQVEEGLATGEGLCWRGVEAEAAGIEGHDAVAEAGGEVHVVGDEEEGATVSVEATEEGRDLCGA